MVITVSSLEDAITKKLNEFFPRDNFVVVNPGRVLICKKYSELRDSIENFPIRQSDIWVVSYPRTGSTWAQEMIWLLGNKLDFERAKNTLLAMRAPILEISALYGGERDEWVLDTLGDSIESLNNVPSPRFARSHLTWDLLPQEIEKNKPKIIYTARNPKDQCVSYYHYFKLVHGLTGSLDEFAEMFLAGNVPFGSYWNHVLPFWNRRNDPNVLFLKYETMKRDLPSIIEKCAQFLELDYEIKSEDMDRICDHLNFEEMQRNPAVNLKPFVDQEDDPKSNSRFIRKGEIGDWKNHLSPELSRKFDEWIVENCRGTSLEFEYE